MSEGDQDVQASTATNQYLHRIHLYIRERSILWTYTHVRGAFSSDFNGVSLPLGRVPYFAPRCTTAFLCYIHSC